MDDIGTFLNGIFQEYASRLFSYGMQICPDKMLVEDAIQETFLDMYRHEDAFSKAKDKRCYIFSSLRYKILSMTEERYSNINLEGMNIPIEDELENMIIGKENESLRKLMVNELFSELSPHQREVLYLRFSEKMSFKEISEFLSIERQSAQNLFGRTIAKLRKVCLGKTIDEYQR